MLRITKESEYAFLLLSAVLAADGTPQSTTLLAAATKIAVPMSGKVLKRLAQRGILTSVRGAHGGYRLSREASTISALDVVEAMEGIPELVECANGEGSCVLANHCQFSPFWVRINDDICAMLRKKTLADMQVFERNKSHIVLKDYRGKTKAS